VVSSDREVRTAAERAGARLISSREFARLLQSNVGDMVSAAEASEKPKGVSEAELEDWLRLFSGSDLAEEDEAPDA
jgi:hypothetical protein